MSRMSFKNPTLGFPITGPSDIAPALASVGLDYTVSMEERINPRTGNPTGLFETYNDATGEMLAGGLTARYNVIQNRSALGTIGDVATIAGKPLHLVSGHAFNGGATAVATVEFNRAFVGDISVGDEVAHRITFGNDHTGGGAMFAQHDIYRARCKNGLATAAKTNRIRIPHTKSAEARIKEAARIFFGLQHMIRATDVAYNVLAHTPVTKELFARVLETLFPADKAKTKGQEMNFLNVKRTIAANFEYADNGTIERNTGWNLYNAITHYTTHEAPVRIHDARTSDAEARAKSQLIGANGEKAHGALMTVLDTLNVRNEIESILTAMGPIDTAAAEVNALLAMID